LKPLPPPSVHGNTDAERMDNAVRRFFSVSKQDFLKAEARGKKRRQRKKRTKKSV
jgi:hypothetical protein